MRRTNIPTMRHRSYIVPTFDEADIDETLLADYQLGNIALDDFISNRFTTTDRFSTAVGKGEEANDADLGEKDSVTLIMHDWDNSGTSIPSNSVVNTSTTMEAAIAQSVHETLRYNINAIRNNVLNAGKYLLNVNLDTDSNSNNSQSFTTGELDAMTITVDDDDDETVLDDDYDEDGDFDEDGYSEESIIGGDEVESMEQEVNVNENKRRLLRYLDLEPKHEFDVTYSDVKSGLKSPKHAKQHHQYEKSQNQLGLKMVKIIIEAEPKAINGKNSNLTDMRCQQKPNSLILGCDNTASNRGCLNDYNDAYEPVDKEISLLF